MVDSLCFVLWLPSVLMPNFLGGTDYRRVKGLSFLFLPSFCLFFSFFRFFFSFFFLFSLEGLSHPGAEKLVDWAYFAPINAVLCICRVCGIVCLGDLAEVGRGVRLFIIRQANSFPFADPLEIARQRRRVEPRCQRSTHMRNTIQIKFRKNDESSWQ